MLDQLRLNGFAAYCPLLRVTPVNPRARKVRPYFPGYVFVQADLTREKASSLQWMPGATGFVSFGGEPARVPDGLIPALRQRVEAVNASGGETLHEIQPGDKVRVRIVEVKKRMAFGEVVEVVEGGPRRVEPPCKYFGKCGG